MQDGALAHCARNVKDLLRQYFGDRVIALDSTPEWAPRSPDLTPCDFHLWDTLKNQVYGRRYETLTQLRQDIW